MNFFLNSQFFMSLKVPVTTAVPMQILMNFKHLVKFVNFFTFLKTISPMTYTIVCIVVYLFISVTFNDGYFYFHDHSMFFRRLE